MAEFLLPSESNTEYAVDESGRRFEVASDLEFEDGDMFIEVTVMPEKQTIDGELLEERHLSVKANGETVHEPNGKFPMAHFETSYMLTDFILSKLEHGSEHQRRCLIMHNEWYRSSPLQSHLPL